MVCIPVKYSNSYDSENNENTTRILIDVFAYCINIQKYTEKSVKWNRQKLAVASSNIYILLSLDELRI